MINLGFEKFKKVQKNKNQFEAFQSDQYYEKDVAIDGLTYQIVFSEFNPFKDKGESNLGIFSLDFSTKEHGGAITNKGIAVFGKLINEMRIFFDEVNSSKQINAITFTPSSSRMNIAEEAQVQNFGKSIEKKLAEDNHLLDGFLKEHDGQKISVENGYLNLSGNFQKPGSFSIRAIVDKTIEPPDVPEWFKPAIWEFTHKNNLDEKLLEKVTDESGKGADQRLALYKRALERNFSEYEFEVIYNDQRRIIVYVNPDKKDQIRQVMLDVYETRNT